MLTTHVDLIVCNIEVEIFGYLNSQVATLKEEIVAGEHVCCFKEPLEVGARSPS